ncbi:MAG: RsmB/NOP family class I SAM-dependent RNA methyltransferase [Candidatus Omnitrophica bacterium]|nr:RsmB/NOP family class I SAM-dependent RNA methyltransferase [Candidatus Omnitrophota bacterium]
MPEIPSQFLDRLRQILPQDRKIAVLETFTFAKPPSFRLNRAGLHPEEIRLRVSSQGLEVVPVAWYPGAFILRLGSISELERTPSFRSGDICVQTLSQMLPALVLDPQPGEQVLDLGAGPGAKATQMACLMRGQGRLVAAEKDRLRFRDLSAGVRMQEAGNVTCVHQDASEFAAANGDCFDKVMVDAGSTEESRFYLADPRTYLSWSEEEIGAMVPGQLSLLRAGVQALKPGGVLVYSTNTFAPEENEAVVNTVLQENDGRVELEEFELPIPNVSGGLCQWSGTEYLPELSKVRRVLPSAVLEGLFLARLRKR